MEPIIIGINQIILSLLIIAGFVYVIRLQRKILNQSTQLFEAITILLNKEIINKMDNTQKPQPKLHQYKGYVIKTIPDENGEFGGLIYDNSMKKVLHKTSLYPSHISALTEAKEYIDSIVYELHE